MATQLQIVKDIAPEMSTLSDSTINSWLTYAKLRVNLTGDIGDLAKAYLAAHMYTLSLRKGAPGALTGEKEGDLSKSYSKTSTIGGKQSGDLEQTVYGATYLKLVRENFVGARIFNNA